MSIEIIPDRRVPLYKLLKYKGTLKQMLSFSANIDRCNFLTTSGWGGKTYVREDGHGVDEHKPITGIRGVDALEIYYLRLTDMVLLTEEQHRDYKAVCEGDTV